jgi:hypothetical protein
MIGLSVSLRLPVAGQRNVGEGRAGPFSQACMDPFRGALQATANNNNLRLRFDAPSGSIRTIILRERKIAL